MSQGSRPRDAGPRNSGTVNIEKRDRRAYSAPHLKVLGDLRDLTLGPSAGVTDSGGQNAPHIVP